MSDPKCAKVLLDAAEKSFKAWLAYLGVTYPLTHNLKTLLDLLLANGARTEPYHELMEFTPFAIEFRYESVDLDIEPIDRSGVLGRLEALHDQVHRLLTLKDEE